MVRRGLTMYCTRLQPTVIEPVRALLFDLDGTLLDSAPDLAAALNRLRRERGMPALREDELRPFASRGAAGMLEAGLPGLEGAASDAARARFLEIYAAASCHRTRPFPGVETLLKELEGNSVPWGVVTNKIERLTLPILKHLGWYARAGAIVCGDTTPTPKPHPAPVLVACERLAIEPAACAFVGDDPRDVAAGRAAGCVTIGAAWGYLPMGLAGEDLGADAVCQTPAQIGGVRDSRDAGTG